MEAIAELLPTLLDTVTQLFSQLLTTILELLPQLIQKHFYHFAHFVEPGAKRIAFSKYTDELDVTAVQNPDGKIVIVILNRSEECLSVVLRLQEHIVPLQVEAQSICTGVIV